jgi:hypothetical protein
VTLAPIIATDERSFGYLLRRYRLAALLTQEQLAERAHLSYRTISDLERGACQFTAGSGSAAGCGMRGTGV